MSQHKHETSLHILLQLGRSPYHYLAYYKATNPNDEALEDVFEIFDGEVNKEERDVVSNTNLYSLP